MEERQVKSPEQACFYSFAVGPVVRAFNFQLVFIKLQAWLSAEFLWDFQSAYSSTQFRYPCPYYIQTTIHLLFMKKVCSLVGDSSSHVCLGDEIE